MSDIRWSGDAEPAPEDAVERVLAACLECEPGERGVALERACSTNPELARDLRQRWSALAAMGLVDTCAPPGPAREYPEQLGDFRLVRRLGGGGMGVVYLAVQSSLDREVALKLVRPEQLFFPRAKERFRREAEAIAKLAHPGIVPIHTVGEEHGVPFFAMELIRGCTLAEALAQLAGRAPESLTGRDLERVLRAAARVDLRAEPHEFFARGWVDTCLALAREVADALEHAHGRGLIHRDVKPSNVMVTPDGRARLVDFGLTAVTEVTSTTRTGAQLGTLHYMAPEQVRASKHVDARADVYGLGVTLYELLTLQLPFRGDDALEVQNAILAGRADSIRARNPDVRPDVEVVCAVAMERDPARRYASAGAFAHDLFNLLERRPIDARPPGVLVRVARFAQRRPALTTSLAAAFVLAVATPSTLYWQAQAHARDLASALGREQAARAEAERQGEVARTAELGANLARSQAEDAASTADASLDFMIELFHGAAPQTRLGRDVSAIELLEDGAQRIEDELADRPGARARLQSSIGEVLFELGRYEQARPLLESAHDTLEQIGDDRQALRANRTLRFLSVTLERLRDYQRAEELARLAVERAREHQGEDPEGFVFAANHLAVVLSSSGRVEEGRAVAQELVDYLETHANVPSRLENLAANLSVLAQARYLGGDLDGAVELNERALAIQRELLPPVHPELHVTLAVLGYYRKVQRKLEEADACYAESACVMDALGIEAGFDFANTLHNWAITRIELKEFDSALALLGRAEEIDRRTFSSSGSITRMCAYGRGRVAMAAGRFEDALRAFDAAAPLFVASGTVDDLRVHGVILFQLANCARKLGRSEQALAAYGRSADVLSTIDSTRTDAVRIWNTMAEVYDGLGRSEEAREVRSRASEAN